MSFGKLETRLTSLAKTPRTRGMAPGKKLVPRREERKPTYKLAKLRSPNMEVRCVVLDISLSGARVKLEGALPLAPEVLLVIPDMAFKRRCLLRWQVGDEAGLMVEPPPPVR